MTDLFRNQRVCWPYSPESFAKCVYYYFPENATSTVRFTLLNLLPLSTDLYKSGLNSLQSFSSDIYKTLQSYLGNLGIAILLTYLAVLLILATFREFRHSYGEVRDM